MKLVQTNFEVLDKQEALSMPMGDPLIIFNPVWNSMEFCYINKSNRARIEDMPNSFAYLAFPKDFVSNMQIAGAVKSK